VAEKNIARHGHSAVKMPFGRGQPQCCGLSRLVKVQFSESGRMVEQLPRAHLMSPVLGFFAPLSMLSMV